MIPNIIFAMKHKDGFVNKYKNKAVETLEQVGRMPAKNNPNPAKTPLFPRFMSNSTSPVPPSTNKVAFGRNHRK